MQKQFAFSNLFSPLSRWWHVQSSYLSNSITSSQPENKFVIFSIGRTGSNLLVSLLDSHPQILCEPETMVLSKKYKIRKPFQYLEGRAKRAKTSYGCKIMPMQIRHFHGKLDSFVQTMHTNNWHFFLLRRRNLIRQAISMNLALHRGKFHTHGTQPDLEDLNFMIDIDDLLYRLEAQESKNASFIKALSPFPYHEIWYEDDLLEERQQQTTATRIFSLLSLPDHRVSTTLKKIGSNDLTRYVKNYDELEAALKGTQYERYLSEI